MESSNNQSIRDDLIGVGIGVVAVRLGAEVAYLSASTALSLVPSVRTLALLTLGGAGLVGAFQKRVICDGRKAADAHSGSTSHLLGPRIARLAEGLVPARPAMPALDGDTTVHVAHKNWFSRRIEGFNPLADGKERVQDEVYEQGRIHVHALAEHLHALAAGFDTNAFVHSGLSAGSDWLTTLHDSVQKVCDAQENVPCTDPEGELRRWREAIGERFWDEDILLLLNGGSDVAGTNTSAGQLARLLLLGRPVTHYKGDAQDKGLLQHLIPTDGAGFSATSALYKMLSQAGPLVQPGIRAAGNVASSAQQVMALRKDLAAYEAIRAHYRHLAKNDGPALKTLMEACMASLRQSALADEDTLEILEGIARAKDRLAAGTLTVDENPWVIRGFTLSDNVDERWVVAGLWTALRLPPAQLPNVLQALANSVHAQPPEPDVAAGPISQVEKVLSPLSRDGWPQTVYDLIHKLTALGENSEHLGPCRRILPHGRNTVLVTLDAEGREVVSAYTEDLRATGIKIGAPLPVGLAKRPSIRRLPDNLVLLDGVAGNRNSVQQVAAVGARAYALGIRPGMTEQRAQELADTAGASFEMRTRDQRDAAHTAAFPSQVDAVAELIVRLFRTPENFIDRLVLPADGRGIVSRVGRRLAWMYLRAFVGVARLFLSGANLEQGARRIAMYYITLLKSPQWRQLLVLGIRNELSRQLAGAAEVTKARTANIAEQNRRRVAESLGPRANMNLARPPVLAEQILDETDRLAAAAEPGLASTDDIVLSVLKLLTAPIIDEINRIYLVRLAVRITQIGHKVVRLACRVTVVIVDTRVSRAVGSVALGSLVLFAAGLQRTGLIKKERRESIEGGLRTTASGISLTLRHTRQGMRRTQLSVLVVVQSALQAMSEVAYDKGMLVAQPNGLGEPTGSIGGLVARLITLAKREIDHGGLNPAMRADLQAAVAAPAPAAPVAARVVPTLDEENYAIAARLRDSSKAAFRALEVNRVTALMPELVDSAGEDYLYLDTELEADVKLGKVLKRMGELCDRMDNSAKELGSVTIQQQAELLRRRMQDSAHKIARQRPSTGIFGNGSTWSKKDYISVRAELVASMDHAQRFLKATKAATKQMEVDSLQALSQLPTPAAITHASELAAVRAQAAERRNLLDRLHEAKMELVQRHAHLWAKAQSGAPLPLGELAALEMQISGYTAERERLETQWLNGPLPVKALKDFHFEKGAPLPSRLSVIEILSRLAR